MLLSSAYYTLDEFVTDTYDRPNEITAKLNFNFFKK